jgi:predicted short-subunit dehydrogenase-like oxidoreductase (DUF2520 family)
MRELEREHPSHVSDQGAPSPICVIGRGRVGGAVQRAASTAGLECRLVGHDELPQACAEARVALICVPDTAIEQVAATLAGAVPPLRWVGHPSGAGGLDLLEPVRARGARGFSIHPLQTIPDPDTPLAGTPAAIAGDDLGALAIARRLARTLGMTPFEVPEDARAAYHAAASIASNFLVALGESATALLAAAGVEDGRTLLSPLMLRSAANWGERGSAALTGPIARGDTATVARHLEAIEELAPELLPLYRALADRTRELPASSAGTGGRA